MQFPPVRPQPQTLLQHTQRQCQAWGLLGALQVGQGEAMPQENGSGRPGGDRPHRQEPRPKAVFAQTPCHAHDTEVFSELVPQRGLTGHRGPGMWLAELPKKTLSFRVPSLSAPGLRSCLPPPLSSVPGWRELLRRTGCPRARGARQGARPGLPPPTGVRLPRQHHVW